MLNSYHCLAANLSISFRSFADKPPAGFSRNVVGEFITAWLNLAMLQWILDFFWFVIPYCSRWDAMWSRSHSCHRRKAVPGVPQPTCSVVWTKPNLCVDSDGGGQEEGEYQCPHLYPDFHIFSSTPGSWNLVCSDHEKHITGFGARLATS